MKWPRNGVTHWTDASFVVLAIKHVNWRILSPLRMPVVGRRRPRLDPGGLRGSRAWPRLVSGVSESRRQGPGDVACEQARGHRLTGWLRCSFWRPTRVALNLNGPAWMDGERPDQTVQFLPACLLIVFLVPFTVSIEGFAQRWIAQGLPTQSWLSRAANLACGFMIIRDHLSHRGPTPDRSRCPTGRQGAGGRPHRGKLEDPFGIA